MLENTELSSTSLPPSTLKLGSRESPLVSSEHEIVWLISGGHTFCGAGSTQLNGDLGGLFQAWQDLGPLETRMPHHLDQPGDGPMPLDDKGRASTLSVTLQAPESVRAGDPIIFTATASGGTGSYRYDWDADDDGVYERQSSESSVTLSKPQKGFLDVRVRAKDEAGATGIASTSRYVTGPSLSVVGRGTPVEQCGDGDDAIDPGEIWNIPMTVEVGDTFVEENHMLLAADSGATNVLEVGPNEFGYAGTAAQSSCPHQFVSISEGPFAVPELRTVAATGSSYGDFDDARTADPIALGGSGVQLYGRSYSVAVMSTNGYVSFDPEETGGDFSNKCGAGLGPGARGPQLRVLHRDLISAYTFDQSGERRGGLRYRFFPTCPRASQTLAQQGCHVFQWDSMITHDFAGAADFQALVYEDSGQIVYQYRRADSTMFSEATIGLIDNTGTDPFEFFCKASPLQLTGQSLCTYTAVSRPQPKQSMQLSQSVFPVGLTSWPRSLVDISVAAKIPEDAACGDPVGIRLLGIASKEYSAHLIPIPGYRERFASGSGYEGAVADGCNIVVGCAIEQPEEVPSRRGLYFNSQRPGNGLNSYFYEIGPGEQYFGGLWYTALPDGTPIWYVVSGPVRGYEGEVSISQVRNVQAPGGFQTLTQSVGRAWVAQVDRDTLLLAWRLNDGRSGIERMDATEGLAFAQSNHTQAWFDPSEEGWGVAIESLDTGDSDFEFFVSFIFDADGLPRWLIGDKPSAESGNVSMSAYRVHCPGCPWYADSLDVFVPSGTLDIDYLESGTAAELTTDLQLRPPLRGSWRRQQSVVTPVAPPQP